MENNYNHYSTHNHYGNCNAFQTQLVRYDKPLHVVIDSDIYEMYGMLIASTCQQDKNGKDNIRTYRIPLTGLEMEPWHPIPMTDSLIILPNNKQLTAKDFDKYIDYFRQNGDMDDAVDELVRKGFHAVCEEEKIKVKIYVDKKRVTLSSEWFDIEMELHEDKWCRPDDFLIVCSIAMFLKKELQFVPHDKDNEKEYTIAAELDRLMNVFNKNNFYSTGKVMNDGFYTYSQDLGRISMTRKEFMEKFPHATAMLEK